MGYHAATGDLCHQLDRLHKQHGEIIRFGPNTLSFVTVEALEAIYGFHCNTQKSQFYSHFDLDAQNKSTMSEINKVNHARKRRIVAQGLTSTSMKHLTPKIITCIDTLTRNLAKSSALLDNKGWTEPKDMGDWTNWFTADVMGSIVFSRNFDLMNTPTLRWLSESMPRAIRLRCAAGLLPLLKLLPLDSSLRQLLAFTTEAINTREASRDDPKLHDLFGAILHATDPQTGTKYRLEELSSEAGLLIVAGGDTTSSALAATFYYLTQPSSAHILTRLQNEIRAAFPTYESILPPYTTDLPLLRAVLDESMRLAPPASGALLREVLPGGIDVGGTHIPAGVDVAVLNLGIMRNETYFPDALSFNPDRWLQDKTTLAYKKASAAFCPFTIGARGCIGRNIAYVEMSTVVARVLWALDMRRVEGSVKGVGEDGLYAIMDSFVMQKEGPDLQFRVRDGAVLPW